MRRVRGCCIRSGSPRAPREGTVASPVERTRIAADLVLVGGGHAHVQVLRGLALAPPGGARVTVVLDRPEAIYSGMVPGFAAGEYRMQELEIDVVPLARRAGAAVVLAAATRVDAAQRRIEVDGRPALDYDVASLDVGASLRGLDLPGVREHAVATRPIRDFVDRLDSALATRLRVADPARVAVVGGGAAGVELAFCLEARLRRAGRRAEVTLFESAPQLLSGRSAGLLRRVRSEARRRGIAIRCGAQATRVDADALWLGDERIAADLVVWASGAAPHRWLADPALPLDAQGFLRVRPTLQVVGRDELFAVGDCASLDAAPWVPKAGVYAVREGPLLERNLRARLAGGGLRAYRPQRDFLASAQPRRRSRARCEVGARCGRARGVAAEGPDRPPLRAPLPNAGCGRRAANVSSRRRESESRAEIATRRSRQLRRETRETRSLTIPWLLTTKLASPGGTGPRCRESPPLDPQPRVVGSRDRGGVGTRRRCPEQSLGGSA